MEKSNDNSHYEIIYTSLFSNKSNKYFLYWKEANRLNQQKNYSMFSKVFESWVIETKCFEFML